MTDERLMTPFGFASTADEVLADVDLSGKRAVVTGAASGIGVETARALASVGAAVTLAVRRPEAAERVATGITESTRNKAVTVRQLDLADQKSVTEFVDGWEGPLHILVNNAGVMALPELNRTREGWEMQFATNFVGHFALTVGLYDALAGASGARIVSLSSTANLSSPVIFDDLHFRFRPYDPRAAYAQSKTATALLAVEATRRWSSEGIYANSLNPGAIADGVAAAHRRPCYPRRVPKDRAARGGNLGAAGSLTVAGRDRRTVLRGLQRISSGGRASN
jgi:NAD(P)-dependent dehydrogenase (short-subunit alcohol dehydrogenase family)